MQVSATRTAVRPKEGRKPLAPVGSVTPTRPELAFSLRLSRASDDSSSFDVQLKACRAQATALGLDPDTAVVYEDYGVSGASTLESRKDGMARILEDKPRVVIAWKIDRFARSLSEFLKLVSWAEEHSVTLATADGALNTTSAGGRLVAKILASLAEWERELIQERVTSAHAERREQGRWISGKAPWPYRVTRAHEKAPAYLAVDEKAAAQCRKAIDALLAGGTLASTAASLPIGRAQWRKLLRGVVLRGWREHGGSLVCGTDGVTPVSFGPEVVDAALYARIKARLKELEAGERAERRNAPWLAGMIRCSQGCAMHGGISGAKRALYKCEKGHGSIMAHAVEPLVYAAFLAEHGAEPLYEVRYSGGVDHSAEMADLDASRERITAAIAKVDGPALNTLTAKLTELEATYARLAAEHDPELRAERIATDVVLGDAFEGGTQQQRRTLLTDYGCTATVFPAGHPGGRLAIEWAEVSA